jgi:tetratricopeptide (TPR) repeat protein
MERRFFRLLRPLLAGICVLTACGFAFAQTSSPSGPINLDRALREDARQEPDRAASYYHYVRSRLYESNGDPANALSEMHMALETNPQSSAIHYELAVLYARRGNFPEAMRYAGESVRLDSENPDPHWLLVNIHLRSQAQRRGGAPAGTEGFRQAVRELEILEKLTPEDERVYYTLGGIYFDLREIEKAIAAYEKYQKYSYSDEGYREIARYYASVNNLDMAVEYLNKALELDPGSAESLMLLGNIYLSQGKNREGAAIFKKLFEVTNGNAQIMRQLALTLIEANDYKEAAGVLEELAKVARPDRDSQFLLGRSYFGMNRYLDAIRLFNEVLSRVSDDVEARFYLAESYARRGRYADAAKLFEDLLRDRENEEAFKNRPLFRERLAGVLLELENYEKAIDLYEEIAEANPGERFRLLEAYRVSEQYDKGLALGKGFLAENPDDVLINVIYARTLADAGKKKEGADVLSRLLQSKPYDIQLYLNLSEIYSQDKRYSDAEKILLRGEEQNSKDHAAVEQLKFNRAAIYEQQKSFDRAEQLFREILETSPDNSQVLNYLGYMLADRGVRLDESIRYISRALEFNPENGAYLDSLGWAYFKLDDMENAEKYLLEAVDIVPGDPTINDHLGDLYFKLGQTEKARDYWEKAVRLSKDPEETQKVRRKLNQLEETPRRKNPSRR